MNKPIKSRTKPIDLMRRVLEEPTAVSFLRQLEVGAIHRLIAYVGLEDSGELVALISHEQLQGLFDEDVWRNDAPGKEEMLDAERFALWIAVMLEVSESFAADRLAAMDMDLLVAALSQHVLVANTDELSAYFAQLQTDELVTSDFDIFEKTLEGRLSHEFEEYWVIAKEELHWDSLLSVFVALDQNHREFFVHLLQKLEYSSNEYIEGNGGLYNVLTAAEQAASDSGYERELRREKLGYVPPRTASHFLALAKQAYPNDILGEKDLDPITKSYFRHYAPPAAPTTASPSSPVSPDLVALLGEAGILESRSLPQLSAAEDSGHDSLMDLKNGLNVLRQTRMDLYQRRIAELNYLANIVIAGAMRADQRYRPYEAAEEVMRLCSVGMRFIRSMQVKLSPEALLTTHDLVKMFRIALSDFKDVK